MTTEQMTPARFRQLIRSADTPAAARTERLQEAEPRGAFTALLMLGMLRRVAR